MQIVFENKVRLGNNFNFKDQIPKDLTSGVVCKCGLSPVMVGVIDT